MTQMDELIARVEAASGPDRFWAKVDRSRPGCWPWTASKNQNGYGQFSVGSRVVGNYRMLKAHRVAFELAKGVIPDGMSIDHICRNRACCNPAHLEAVTTAENNKRAGAAKECCARGHIFTPENTLAGRNGTRECRACRIQRRKGYRDAAKSS